MRARLAVMCALVWAHVGHGINMGLTFRRLGKGICGPPHLSMVGVTPVHCAAVCAADPTCLGFSSAFSPSRPRARCEATAHLNTSSDTDTILSDTNPAFTCYVVDDVYWSLVSATTEMTYTWVPTTEMMTTWFPTTDMINTSVPTTEMMTTWVPTTEITTTSAPYTSPSTSSASANTTTSTPLSELELVTSDLGISGLQIIGFRYSNDSHLGSFYFSSYLRNATPPPVVASEVLKEGGEQCAAEQVMVGVGHTNTGNIEKDDQRMYCAALTPPLTLLSTCEQVQLGQPPRPTVEGMNTSSWLSWLACKDSYMLTKLEWVYDASALYTEYRYYAAVCCQVIDAENDMYA